MTIEELGKHCVIIDFNDLFTKSVTNINYKQGELGTSLIKARLVKKRTPIDLTGCRVILNVMTEKGEPIVDTATVLEATEGIVEIKFEQVCLTTGTNFFELTIIDENSRTKKSPKIAYRVLDSLSEDGIIESERFPILVNMIKEVEGLHKTGQQLVEEVTQLNTTVQEAETTRNSNEETRTSSENTRVTSEEARVASEVSRNSNEETRQTQETQRVNSEGVRSTSEETRTSNENTRQTQEATRVEGETQRLANEEVRQTQEGVRVSNETDRQTKDTEREETFNLMIEDFDNKVNEVDSKITEVNTSKDTMVEEVALEISKSEDKIVDCENRMKGIEGQFEALVDGTGFARKDYVDAELTKKANVVDIYTKEEVDNLIGSETSIDDNTISETSVWSSSKVNTELEKHSLLEHNHDDIYAKTSDTTFTGVVTTNKDGEYLKTMPFTAGKACFQGFYKDKETRSAYLGYATDSNSDFSIVNSVPDANIHLNIKGNGRVKINNYTVLTHQSISQTVDTDRADAIPSARALKTVNDKVDNHTHDEYISRDNTTFTNKVTIEADGEFQKVAPSEVNQSCFQGFYKDKETRSAYFGYGSGASSNLSIVNEVENADLLLGTKGTGKVKVNGSEVLLGRSLSNAIDNDSSINIATSKAVKLLNDKISENTSEIESLKRNVDSAKEGIVSAIGGNEINDNSTFEEIKNHLVNIKNELASQLNDKGVAVEGIDGLLDIVDKVGDIKTGLIASNAPNWAVGEFEVHDKWIMARDVITGRSTLTSSVANGKIYVIGGVNYSNKNECYDTTTNTWTTKANMPTGREDLTSSAVGGKIYVFGGLYGSYMDTNKNECYDTTTNTWTTKANMSKGRYKLTSSVVNNKIYAIGGFSKSGRSNENECYDTTTDTWTTKSNMPTTREYLASSSVDNKIYCIGGYDSGNYLNVNECYDTTTNTWTTKANMPTGRSSLTSSTVDSKIYVFGGNGSTKKENECYDTTTNKWTTKTNMPTSGSALTSSSIDNKIYVFGSNGGNKNECYIP